MDSVLSHAIITNAKSAVEAYMSSATNLFGQLEGVINPLTSTNFQGDASDGYLAFFTNTVRPALTDNLTDQQSSLMASIRSMLEGIEEQLLNQVDPQLGENNRNPGGAATAE